MAAKTSGELEQEFIADVKKITGTDLRGWMAVIDGRESKKRNDILAWLKGEKGLGHMHASFLTGIYMNGGKPVYASTDNLLENQFAKAEEMRPLYDALMAFVKKNFPDSSVLPKKTYVSILEKREFGAVNIKPKELRLGLDLGEREFDDEAGKAKLSGPMPRISHMVVITGEDQLDDKLIDLLSESRSKCH